MNAYNRRTTVRICLTDRNHRQHETPTFFDVDRVWWPIVVRKYRDSANRVELRSAIWFALRAGNPA